MAVPEIGLEVSSDIGAYTTKEPEIIRRSGLTPALMVVGGVVAVALAGWVLRSANAPARTIVALVGAGALWRGVQQLASMRYGPNFKLGLVVSWAWVTVVVGGAVFARWLPIEHWKTSSIPDRLTRPHLGWSEPLGRTADGYSILSHVVYGARASLTIGVVAVVVGISIGMVAGLLTGWYGKSVDASVSILTNTILAFPPLILLMSVAAVYGSSVTSLALGLAVLTIPTYTRLMRAQTLSTKQREYILAARVMGASNRRLIWREVLPNTIVPVASYSFLVLASLIVAEGSLSFLGLGIPSPQPSWGGMIAKGQPKLKTDLHLVAVPAVVMFLTVIALNRIGEWARRRAGMDRSEDR